MSVKGTTQSNLVFCFRISVTRFGEISPLRRNIKQLWQILKAPLSIWKNFEHTLANFLCNWANFQCCKWPNIEKVI